jgi:hypothetical protein
MACTTCSCPHPPCTHDGHRGCAAPRLRRGAARGRPRLRCPMGAGTFAVRQGTAYVGVRAEEPHDPSARRALAAGHALRGTGRLVGGWGERAGRPGRAVPAWLVDPVPRTACPGDASTKRLAPWPRRSGPSRASPGCGGPARRDGAWEPPAGWAHATQRVPTCGGRVGTLSVGLCRAFPGLRGRPRPRPYGLCRVGQRCACTARANAAPSPPHAPPPGGRAGGAGHQTPATRARGGGPHHAHRRLGCGRARSLSRFDGQADAQDPWRGTPPLDGSPGSWPACSPGAPRRHRPALVREASRGARGLFALGAAAGPLAPSCPSTAPDPGR